VTSGATGTGREPDPPTRHGGSRRPRLYRLVQLLPGLRGEVGAAHVARAVYGAVLALSVLLVLDYGDYGPPRAGLVLLATLTAIALAEAYSDGLAHEITAHRRMNREERAESRESALAVVGAGAPAVVVLELGSLLADDEVVFASATWLTVLLLALFGFGSRRLAGASVPHALRSGAVAAGIGVALALLKALLH
jgi:hypothetical protein